MTTATEPTKSQRREFSRWANILKLREAGVPIETLAKTEDVSTTQIYALLARARKAKELGWI